MLPTKKERQAELLHSGMLRCPVCHEALTLIHTASLVCANRHCFDVSRYGYVHLARIREEVIARQLFADRLRAGGVFVSAGPAEPGRAGPDDSADVGGRAAATGTGA
ncbi:hypothetical protein AV540_10995 [Brevibacillus parabrevis]|uniref:putative RNA methyltransferase n=1 Tax=Brevibacillus parabrevis TaxID=54914 RepID=UPI0007ABCCD5|nr:hypothetical protein [Brevibacillus parabrevis]KZE52381.1 hypothetical protein AV540_10995 [Brevibacillus parabrevis]